MPVVRAAVALCALIAAAAPNAHADEPFYKGKRLTVLINFASGGPTDIEGRLFAKHLARYVEGEPNIIIQNMEGAGGIVGAKYLGEVAPRDGTMAGYFTGTAFMYALDPERFRVDFKSYQFVAIQPGTTVHFVRSDLAPGMREPSDIVKAQGLIVGGLSVDTPKTCGGGSPWTCSASRSNTSPAIARARRRGSRSSAAKSTSSRNRRRAIAVWSSPPW
jgi:putative tricarboxylic transport membrane protein